MAKEGATMNCPKCSLDKTTGVGATQEKGMLLSYYFCPFCGCTWTDWQQQEIDRLMGLLREIETLNRDYCVEAAVDIAKRAREK
jgi:transposase-like protein